MGKKSNPSVGQNAWTSATKDSIQNTLTIVLNYKYSFKKNFFAQKLGSRSS